MTTGLDSRAEGVYCSWESYPRDTPGVKDNTFVVERVNGDGTVKRFECARSETHVISTFLRDN